MRLVLRTVGMLIGLFAAVLMLLVNILYTLAHALSRLTGYPADTTHFFIGLMITLVALVGAFLADPLPTASIVMMLVGMIAFFFIAGAWAIIPAVFIVIAAAIIFFDRSRRRTL